MGNEQFIGRNHVNVIGIHVYIIRYFRHGDLGVFL